jgi:alpha-tubulin suppressor-like RCC1 family protein
MALLIDGTIWAWGKNTSGQLGDSTTADKNNPVKIGYNSTWIYITAGNNFSHGIKKDGSIWAWGKNEVGQLGNGSNSNMIWLKLLHRLCSNKYCLY